MEQSPEANSHSASQEIVPFMEPRGSLLRSQELSTDPYVESSPKSCV